MKQKFMQLKLWLQSLSFRTGVIVLLCCIPFYILSFAQMLLPISVTAKGILWTILFGLAKTCQYGGLTILGVEGYKRLMQRIKRKKTKTLMLIIIFAISTTMQTSCASDDNPVEIPLSSFAHPTTKNRI